MTEVYPMSSTENTKSTDKPRIQNEDEQEGFFDIPEYPRMDYEDIFNEPIAYKTKGLGTVMFYGITKVFGGAFNYTQSTVYYVLVMASGLLLGFAWGVIFGALVFVLNWFLHPLYKLLFIAIQLVGMLVRPAIRIFIDPVFESMGLCLRTIKGAMDVRVEKRTVAFDSTGKFTPEQVNLVQDV